MLIAFILIGLIILLFLLSILQKKEKTMPINEDYQETEQDSEIQTLEKQLLKNPSDIPVLFSISNLYYQEGNFKDALTNIKILIDQDLSQMRSLQIKTFNLAADIAFKLKNIDKAEIFAQKAYEIDSTEIETLKRMAKAKYTKGDFDSAADFSKNITILDSTIFEGHYYWGMSEYQKGNLDSTLQNLDNALKLNPTDFNSLITLGKTYARRKETNNAFIYFNKAIRFAKEEKDHIDILYNRGTLFKNDSRFKEAAEDFMNLLKKSPQDGIKLLALKALIEINKEEKNISQVIWYIKDFLKIKPDDPYYLKDLQYYLELNSSTMFQKFEMVNGNEFLQLCMEIAEEIQPLEQISESKLKKDQSIELIIITKSKNDSHKELIWFIRSPNPIGIIPINNLYARMRQISAKECRIVSNTIFSEEAKEFSKTRMIKLIEKEGLIKQLNKIVEKKELKKVNTTTNQESN